MKIKLRPRCYFDINIGHSPAGRIVFELYDELCPKTVQNFLKLCTGECGIGKTTNKKLHYLNTNFHRVIKGFMIQGGDFSSGDGTGGESIYGDRFEDENLDTLHDKPYLLSMANCGPNTNGSQFFITTKAVPHLNKKHVVFGHVVSGENLIESIENLPVNSNNRPVVEATIGSCGELIPVRKKKAKKDKENSVDSSSSKGKKGKKSKKRKHKNKKKSKNAEMVDVQELNPNCSVRPDEIPEVPKPFFLYRGSLKEDLKEKGVENTVINTNEELQMSKFSSKDAIGRSGRIIKGRGQLRYMSQSPRGRSETPPHWKTDSSNRTNINTESRDDTERKRKRSTSSSKEVQRKYKNDNDKNEKDRRPNRTNEERKRVRKDDTEENIPQRESRRKVDGNKEEYERKKRNESLGVNRNGDGNEDREMIRKATGDNVSPKETRGNIDKKSEKYERKKRYDSGEMLRNDESKRNGSNDHRRSSRREKAEKSDVVEVIKRSVVENRRTDMDVRGRGEETLKEIIKKEVLNVERMEKKDMPLSERKSSKDEEKHQTKKSSRHQEFDKHEKIFFDYNEDEIDRRHNSRNATVFAAASEIAPKQLKEVETKKKRDTVPSRSKSPTLPEAIHSPPAHLVAKWQTRREKIMVRRSKERKQSRSRYSPRYSTSPPKVEKSIPVQQSLLKEKKQPTKVIDKVSRRKSKRDRSSSGTVDSSPSSDGSSLVDTSNRQHVAVSKKASPVKVVEKNSNIVEQNIDNTTEKFNEKKKEIEETSPSDVKEKVAETLMVIKPTEKSWKLNQWNTEDDNEKKNEKQQQNSVLAKLREDAKHQQEEQQRSIQKATIPSTNSLAVEEDAKKKAIASKYRSSSGVARKHSSSSSSSSRSRSRGGRRYGRRRRSDSRSSYRHGRGRRYRRSTSRSRHRYRSRSRSNSSYSSDSARRSRSRSRSSQYYRSSKRDSYRGTRSRR